MLKDQREQRGRIAFEAFHAFLGDTVVWNRLPPEYQQAWIAAADAVFATTLCHFDLEGQKSADSHAEPK